MWGGSGWWLLDLAGRILFENVSEGIAGQQILEWNGVNNFGQRVAPGLYLAEISIAGDAGEEIERRLISVLH